MKRGTMAGLLALCLAAPLGALAEDDSTKARDLSQEFNVSSSQLMDIRQNQNLDWSDIKTSLMISKHSGTSLDEVVRLKKSGLSFDDIASRYNLKLSDIEKEHVSGKKEKEEFREAPAPRRVHRRAARLADEFEVSGDEVMRLRDRGLGWREIRHALFISEQSGRPVNEIVGLKDSGMDWDDIAARYNVDLKEEGRRTKEKGKFREAPAQRQEPGQSGQMEPGGEQMPGQTEPVVPPAGQGAPQEPQPEGTY
ncbi:MAG: hypothetical protein HY554_11255 [Elusimicrobia bacterium]|nr:hypothetical protein [Elusimicrobiota bacterium]